MPPVDAAVAPENCTLTRRSFAVCLSERGYRIERKIRRAAHYTPCSFNAMVFPNVSQLRDYESTRRIFLHAESVKLISWRIIQPFRYQLNILLFWQKYSNIHVIIATEILLIFPQRKLHQTYNHKFSDSSGMIWWAGKISERKRCCL